MISHATNKLDSMINSIKSKLSAKQKLLPFQRFRNNPRLAVQMSGNLRTFEKCAENLRKNLLDIYDCDLFIHTWDRLDHNSLTWHNNRSDGKTSSIDNTMKEKIGKIYNPREIEIEQSWTDTNDRLFGTDENVRMSLQGVEAAIHSKFRANALRVSYEAKNSIAYDAVIFIRPDLKINEAFCLEDLERYFMFDHLSSIHFVNVTHLYMAGHMFVAHYHAMDAFHVCLPIAAESINFIKSNFCRFYCDYINTLPEPVAAPEVSFHEALIHSSLHPKFYKFDYELVRLPPTY